MLGEQLSQREREVLVLLSHGLTTRQIAHRLGRNYNTIALHRKQILRKLGVKTTLEALRVARELGLLEADT